MGDESGLQERHRSALLPLQLPRPIRHECGVAGVAAQLQRHIAVQVLAELAGWGGEPGMALATPLPIRVSRSKMKRASVAALVFTVLLTACVSASRSPKPIEVKVVVVAMFEIGADSGDAAGEFQLWHERQKLDLRFPFAHHHDLFLNPKTGVLGMVTGIGSINSASAVMELGLDPRFDLSHAYWVVAGIAGVDPEDASIGSAAWAEYLVDGDLAHEIDAREIPADWPTGYFARNTRKPYDPNKPKPTGEMFQLNPQLTEWVFELTRGVTLDDSKQLQETRSHFAGYPNAQKPPFVLKGDNLAGMTFWHGKILNEWANR